MNAKAIRRLVRTGDLEVCPACNAINAYAEVYCDSKDDPLTIAIYYIGVCSCFDWQCGRCGRTLGQINSPTLAEVYTHETPPPQVSKREVARLRRELAEDLYQRLK